MSTYEIGKKVGMAISPNGLMGRVIDQVKMTKAENFFNRHGGKTIVIAHFLPFIRTFIPFVAGASRMNYSYFLFYNVVGAALWVGICTMVGFFFGNILIIKANFSTVLLLIIFVSCLPELIGLMKSRLHK